MLKIQLQPKHTRMEQTMAVQELTSLLDSALRMGEVNGGAEWSNALLFDDVLRRLKDDTASTTENTTSSEDATKWRFDTARRLGTVSLYNTFGLYTMFKVCVFSQTTRVRALCTRCCIRVFRIFCRCACCIEMVRVNERI
jgi:hypothetical protein